ncbi:MAG TPA: IS4 family transposase [Gemmatimonadales bacterium]|nr:IS4 family transposase [Gemmatimonadales bacterium]
MRRRRSGAVVAAGWLPDHVRLGVLEDLLPAGVIDRLVAAVAGVRDAQRRRVMSAALTVRFVLALALWPEADYVQVMRRLVGDLPDLPWERGWQVPGSRVISDWRARVPAALFEHLFWAVAGPLADDGEPGLYVNGLLVCALDGLMLDLPDTDANRAWFGSAGRADNAGPFPQLRAVIMVACQTRGALAAAVGPARRGEQTLTKRMVSAHPQAFAAGRLIIMDRNFPGYRLIEAIRTAGAHVLIRIKAGIALPVVRVLPDGSYLTYLFDRRRQACMMLRVVEFNVTVPGRDQVSETFTLATSLLDETEWTSADLRAAYPLRWSGAETTIGQNKSAITDAGPSRGPMLRACAPEQIVQEFWAWLVTTQLIRAAGAHAAAAANTGQVRLGLPSRPRDVTTHPVTCREIGFTTTRRTVAATSGAPPRPAPMP